MFSITHTISELRETVNNWRTDGLSVGLVPTMGALHEGHLTLVRAALKECDRVIVTIFVNPKQFGENEDFGTYPRMLKEDASLVEKTGGHLVFAPNVEEMYGQDGGITKVMIAGDGEILEGAFRPGFFDGVATVVTKLFLQSLPDKAFFGEKDFQQLSIIRRFTTDLNIPVEVIGVPTVRETDGLALSSRNAYLTENERKIAPILHQTILEISKRFDAGEAPEALIDWGTQELINAGFASVDYIVIRDAARLSQSADKKSPKRVLVAAKLGKARLIDNIH